MKTETSELTWDDLRAREWEIVVQPASPNGNRMIMMYEYTINIPFYKEIWFSSTRHMPGTIEEFFELVYNATGKNLKWYI